MLGAVIAHPDHKEVIPLTPEPITKQDGDSKDDCERNAAKRLLPKIRKDHPHLPLIVVEDSLAANAPHIRELKKWGMHFLLVAKPGDHVFLFEQLVAAFEKNQVTTIRWREGKVACEVSFVHKISLNKSNQDLKVNVLQYSESTPDGKKERFLTWITDLPITRGNAKHLVRGARARWHIENETFNTLKNQGYHYEHNYGHGEEHLCVVFAMLMMLTFLIDQVQQACCPLFRAAWAKVKSKRALWQTLRSYFYHFILHSMTQLYELMLLELKLEPPIFDTS
jgi:hypothetical protein